MASGPTGIGYPGHADSTSAFAVQAASFRSHPMSAVLRRSASVAPMPQRRCLCTSKHFPDCEHGWARVQPAPSPGRPAEGYPRQGYTPFGFVHVRWDRRGPMWLGYW